MNTIIFFTLTVLFVYVCLILRLKVHWKKYRKFSPSSYEPSSPVSVVIAFRNEVIRLEGLLTSLASQHYPENLFEVVLVDDFSDDGSDLVVRRFCKNHPHFRYVHPGGRMPGKKQAVRAGIENAVHEIIVTTDADCTMNEYWLASISQFYIERKPDMIIGLVDMDQGNGFFEKFQETDFLSLIAAGAGTAAAGHPVYCNAANLSFRKSLFYKLDNPLQEGIISGDDTFLLHAGKRNKKKILLLKSTDSIVRTTGPRTMNGYINQRLRWASKGRNYRDRDTVLVALLVLTVSMVFLFGLALLLLNRNIWLFPVILAVKTLADHSFLKSFMRFLNKPLPMIRFMGYSMLYPFTIVLFAIGGFLSGFSWKGRYYRT
jgi:glycosyltransferase involved in cell wall biosynthesis